MPLQGHSWWDIEEHPQTKKPPSPAYYPTHSRPLSLQGPSPAPPGHALQGPAGRCVLARPAAPLANNPFPPSAEPALPQSGQLDLGPCYRTSGQERRGADLKQGKCSERHLPQ